MSITVINFHDQALVDSINAAAARRAEEEAARAAEEAAKAASADFASLLSNSSNAYANINTTASAAVCPEDLNAIFDEAANTYGVSANLLKSIAKAESGFNPNVVSHAGAVGIMQLMPSTAASLGVTNSYDPRENIMGGTRLISQLLSKYNGNTALALAAYNAGSGNVEKYGGIPPFTETQNYVRTVLSYMNAAPSVDNASPIDRSLSAAASNSVADAASTNNAASTNDAASAGNSPLTTDSINEMLHNYFASQGISKEMLDLLTNLVAKAQNTDSL